MKHICIIIISLMGLMGISFAQNLNLQTRTHQSLKTSQADIIDNLSKQVAILSNEVKMLKNEIYKLKSSIPIGFAKTTDNRYVFSANGANFEVGKEGEVTIKALKGLILESASNTEIKAGFNANISSSAAMDIKGAIIRLNGGSYPVSHVNSVVTGATPSGPLTGGRVAQGSPTVFVP
jgi:hypothetical protein